jgi:hypothetical protein
MFTSVGVAASSGVAAALIVGVSILPTLFIQWRGERYRSTGKNISANDQEQAVVEPKKV